MDKKHAIIKACLPVMSLWFFLAVAGGTSKSPYILDGAVSDSTRIETPTGSGVNYDEDVDVDTGVNSDIRLMKLDIETTNRFHDLSGSPVTKPNKGKVYVKKGKKFIF